MLVFDPCDFLFRSSCEAAGANPVPVPVAMDPKTRTMDLSRLEDYVTPRTRMLGLCNPHNPYGLVYTEEQLEDIMSFCEEHDLLIPNDEIWSDIIYPDAAFRSIYGLGNERCSRVLSIFGFSKSFGLAGLRIGCAYATDPEKYEKLVEHSDVLTTAGGVSSLSQVAATAAMEKSYWRVDEFLKHLEQNRNRAVDSINKLPGLHAYRPKATYLLFVDIADTGLSGEAFCDFMKREAKLALIPGGHKFFGDESEGHVRICFATSRKILDEGLERLRYGMELLRKAAAAKQQLVQEP